MLQSSEPEPRSEPRVPGPTPEAASLRAAYLELLKLCLCDLCGASTREVRWTADRRVFWRTLTDTDQLGHRAEGKDWPLDGLTMIGLDRLNDLQRCVESVVADGVHGDLIEAGAWRGGASILIRATLDSLGAWDRTLWVADSFQGFPAPDLTRPQPDRELEADLSRIDFLAPSLDTVKEYFTRFGVADGVRFVPGFFEDTMYGLRGHRWSLVRLDADTYRATRLTLESLYPRLETGGYVIVDDYFHPYLAASCRKAVDDFRDEHSIDEPIDRVDWNGARWRRQSAPERASEQEAPHKADTGAGPMRPGTENQPRASPIPSDGELQLQDRVAALHAELLSARTELERRAEPRFARLFALARRRANRS
jgi:hypothetical protein